MRTEALRGFRFLLNAAAGKIRRGNLHEMRNGGQRELPGFRPAGRRKFGNQPAMTDQGIHDIAVFMKTLSDGYKVGS
jgi:hypothetical protein